MKPIEWIIGAIFIAFMALVLMQGFTKAQSRHSWAARHHCKVTAYTHYERPIYTCEDGDIYVWHDIPTDRN